MRPACWQKKDQLPGVQVSHSCRTRSRVPTPAVRLAAADQGTPEDDAEGHGYAADMRKPPLSRVASRG
jgi:hypothetical protein